MLYLMEQEVYEFGILEHCLESGNYWDVPKLVSHLLALIKAWLLTNQTGYMVLKLSGKAYAA